MTSAGDGDHELEAKNTGQYADYGRENIGRITRFGYMAHRSRDRRKIEYYTGNDSTAFPKPMKSLTLITFNDPHLIRLDSQLHRKRCAHVVEIQSDRRRNMRREVFQKHNAQSF